MKSGYNFECTITGSALERDVMHWYWQVGGRHTHVKVYMNGAKCGDLCFTNEEFEKITIDSTGIRFHKQTP